MGLRGGLVYKNENMKISRGRFHFMEKLFHRRFYDDWKTRLLATNAYSTFGDGG